VRRSSAATLARLLAGTALAGFVAGVPIVLGVFGSPLPTHPPSWNGFLTDLRMGYLPSDVLAKMALGAAWATWAFLSYEVAAESASWMVHKVARQHSALGPFQPLLSKLVAAVVLSAPLSSRLASVPATPVPRPQVVALAAQPAGPRLAPLVLTSASAPSLPSYVVQPHDTLWGIAERYLGDPLRWSEIAALNEGRVEGSARLTDPHWIYPGWTLLLPADAAGLPQAPTSPSIPTTAASGPSPQPGTEGSPQRASGARDAEVAPSLESPARPDGAGARPVAADGAVGSSWGSPSHMAIVSIGSGILAVGVRGVIERKRRAQHRRRRSGRRIPLPTGELRDVETALFVGSDAEAARWANRAVRLLARALQGAEKIPKIQGLLVGPRVVEVLLEEPVPAPAPFRDGEAGRWALERSHAVEQLDAEALGFPGVLPALVTMGRSAEGVVLLNLEAAGTVSISAPSPQAGRALASAMALELASAPWVDALDLVVVGIEERAFSGLDTLELFARCERLAGALDKARLHAADMARYLADIDEEDAAVVRMRDLDANCTPLVVICGDPATAEELAALGELADAKHQALAVVVAGQFEGAGWDLMLEEDGVLRVEPLGIELTAQQLSTEELGGIGDLLSLASRRDDVGADASPYDVLVDPVCEELLVGPPIEEVEVSPSEPPWEPPEELHVIQSAEGDARSSAEPCEPATEEKGLRPRHPELLLMGPVDLRGVGELPRGKEIEFTAYLALHPAGADLDTIACALWPNETRAASSLWSLSSTVRRALGTDEGGQLHLPRYGRLRLGPGVGCDWARFCALERSPDRDARREALALVRGKAFSGVDWPWAVTEGIAGEMEARITDLAARLGNEALAQEALEEARFAADQGLLASPYDERLFRILMEVASRTGGAGAVRQVMRRLAAVLEAEVEPEGVVEEETWALYQRLTHPAPPRRAGPGRPAQRA
jgi:DNA-binding SARP family transcriptional activator